MDLDEKKIKVLMRILEEHPPLLISMWKTDHLRQSFCVCFELITQLDQEDYHLFYYL